jgi:hypothetical protein
VTEENTDNTTNPKISSKIKLNKRLEDKRMKIKRAKEKTNSIIILSEKAL